jgi:hypothetical protein
MKTEQYLQTECIIEFRNQLERYGKGIVIPVPNELARKRKDVIIKKGCSDLILFLSNEVIFCELKVGYNNQTPEQIGFESEITALGYEYHLIRDIETFKKLIYDKTGKQGI